jgi:hypothetical protein
MILFTISFRSTTVDNFLAEVPALRMIEQLNFPALREETQDLDNTVEQDLPNVQDGHHPVPGPENGDPVNEQILQGEHRVVEGESIGTIQHVVCQSLAFSFLFFSFFFLKAISPERKNSIGHCSKYERLANGGSGFMPEWFSKTILKTTEGSTPSLSF